MVAAEGRRGLASLVRRALASLIASTVTIGLVTSPLTAQNKEPSIRATDRGLIALLERGVAGSATFRSLVARLHATPVVVYLECDPFPPTGMAARLTFISSVGEWRYMTIRIDCRINIRRQLPVLAHELQHALEIAETPEVVDDASMESLYREIGFETYANNRGLLFDTQAARQIQRRVDQELSERSIPKVEPERAHAR